MEVTSSFTSSTQMALASTLSEKLNGQREPIAIVGMAVKFPGAPDTAVLC